MTTELIVRDRYNGFQPEMLVYDAAFLSMEGRFAINMMERIALACCSIEGGGEDSAGRARWRNMTPDEIAKRACDIAESAFKQFRERGWLTEGPTYAEICENLKDSERK